MRFLLLVHLCSKIFKRSGCNFAWSFGKVMCIKSLKMVLVARTIRQKLCIFWFFSFKNHFWPKIIFLPLRYYFYYPGSIVYLTIPIFCFVHFSPKLVKIFQIIVNDAWNQLTLENVVGLELFMKLHGCKASNIDFIHPTCSF